MAEFPKHEKWREALWVSLDGQARILARSRYEFLCSRLEAECESPIERLLVTSMLRLAPMQDAGAAFLLGDKGPHDRIPGMMAYYLDFYRPADVYGEFGRVVVMFPQITIDRFRVDFLLSVASRASMRAGARIECVIECDGHDFHERTKEQAARDRARDRWFQLQKMPIFRFTGAEIHEKALDCLIQPVGYVLDEIAAVERPVREREASGED